MTAKKNRANQHTGTNGEDAARAEANAKAAAEEAARKAEEAAEAASEAEADAEDAEAEADEARIAELEAQVDDLKERLQRAMAETENVRRRGEKQKSDARKYAVTGLAGDMLGVVDNLRRAVEAVSEEDARNNETLRTLLDGVKMTEKELADALEKHGVTPVQAVPGEKFNPHYHEAMFEVPTDEQQPGTIVHILQTGYMLNDRLLRPARVGVAKAADQG